MLDERCIHGERAESAGGRSGHYRRAAAEPFSQHDSGAAAGSACHQVRRAAQHARGNAHLSHSSGRNGPAANRPGQGPIQPGLFGLALALCGGIALGLAAKYLLTGKLGNDNERAVHAILSALVLGIVAEFVGIMLTAYGNSRLVLFGLDIDPRQLFPAFILAMLVSGGRP